MYIDPQKGYFDIETNLTIIIPPSYLGKSVKLNLTDIGPADKIINLSVNGQILFAQITSSGVYLVDLLSTESIYRIEFVFRHTGSSTDSILSMIPLVDSIAIPDLSASFSPDSDGDGLLDINEFNSSLLIPDYDKDGLLDGNDFSINQSINMPANSQMVFNFPIKNPSGSSEIKVDIQIKPTFNDYTQDMDYGGNVLQILPGIRIFNQNNGGDYLPNNSITIDDGLTGLIYFLPIKNSYNNETCSWMGQISYKYNNIAKTSNQIRLKFRLVWLAFEVDVITHESTLLHIYDNNDPYALQGITINEFEPVDVNVILVNDGESYTETVKYASVIGHYLVSSTDYDPADSIDLEYISSNVLDLANIQETRDVLNEDLIELNSLNPEQVYSLSVISGYSYTYDIRTIFDTFGVNPQRLYTQSEIDGFYASSDHSFLGIADIQLMHDNDITTIGNIYFGTKTSTEMKTYSITFSTIKYVGSSCYSIIRLEGSHSSGSFLEYSFSIGEKSSTITSEDRSGGYFNQILHDMYGNNVVILYVGEMNPDVAIPVLQFFVKLLQDFYTIWNNPWVKAAFWVCRIVLFITKLIQILQLLGYTFELGTIASWVFAAGTFLQTSGLAKAIAWLGIIAGAITIGIGIYAFVEGMYATGTASMIRGGLQIATGILLLATEPLYTKIAALILLAVQFLDFLLQTVFGFDLWKAFANVFLGIEDANPVYEIQSASLNYNQAAFKEHGGFEVGDAIGASINLVNTGNTRLMFSLGIGSGNTQYGPIGYQTLERSGQGALTAQDTFDAPGTVSELNTRFTLNWYYDPPGHLAFNPFFPPFIFWLDLPPVQGDEQAVTDSIPFNIPIFPTSLGSMINLVKSGSWFPISTPEVEVENEISTEFIPGTSEFLEYSISVSNPSSESHSYRVTPSNLLWETKFFNRNYFEDYVNVTVPADSSISIPLKIFPTEANDFVPGDFNMIVQVVQNDLSIAKSITTLHYKILEVPQFDAILNPSVSETIVLVPYDVFRVAINISNTGNCLDNYTIEISGLNTDLYLLHTSGAEAAPRSLISAGLIEFRIQPAMISTTPPGLIPFVIRVISVKDPTVIEEISLILDIQIYYSVEFISQIPLITSMDPGETTMIPIDIQNTGNVIDTYSYTIVSLDVEGDMRVDPVSIAPYVSLSKQQVTLSPGASDTVILTIAIPFNWPSLQDINYSLLIQVSSQSKPEVQIEAPLNATIVARPESALYMLLEDIAFVSGNLSLFNSGSFKSLETYIVNCIYQELNESLISALSQNWYGLLERLTTASTLENVFEVNLALRFRTTVSERSLLQLLNNTIYVLRSDIYTAMAFVTWYATGIIAVYEIATLARKVGILSDNLLYGNAITSDIDGTFSRERDNVTDYLPLVYDLGVGLNLQGISLSLSMTYRQLISDEVDMAIILLSNAKFFTMTTLLSMQILRMQGKVSIEIENRWKASLREIRNQTIVISTGLVDSTYAINIADAQLAIYAISDNIVDNLEGEIDIEFCTRSPTGEEYSFTILLLESLPTIFLESAAWSLDYALVCLAREDLSDAYCAVRGALVKLNLANNTLSWYVQNGWISEQFASETMDAVQHVVNDVDLLADALLDELLEDPYWRLWYMLGWFFEFLWFLITVFYFT